MMDFNFESIYEGESEVNAAFEAMFDDMPIPEEIDEPTISDIAPEPRLFNPADAPKPHSSSAPKKDRKQDVSKNNKNEKKSEKNTEKKTEKKPAKTEKKKAKKYDELILDRAKKEPEKKNEKKEPINNPESTQEPESEPLKNNADEITDDMLKPVNCVLDDYFEDAETVEEEFFEEAPEEASEEGTVAPSEKIPEEVFEETSEETIKDNVPEPEVEVIQPDNDNIINDEPCDDVIDADDISKMEYIDKAKKIMAFAAMLLLLIGIPVILSSFGNTKGKKKGVVAKSKIEVATEADISEREKSTVYEEVQNDAYKTLEKTNSSSRFKTIEDLTFYIESNTNAILSSEQILVNSYKSGKISKNEFAKKAETCVAFTDDLNHLLVANKKVYKNMGQEDKYLELSDALDSLIAYGDSLVR